MSNLEIRQQRETIELQYKHKNEKLREKGRQLVYDNQKEAAYKCFEAFEKGALAVVLIAQPGVGKTGVGLELMRMMGEHPDDHKIINVNNMFQITGMSDRDWKEQLTNNILDVFKNNIYHRGTIQTIQDQLQDLLNGLVICDECHIAAGKNMKLSTTLRNAGLLDLEILENNKVKLLDISATPENVLYDFKDWGDKVAYVMLKPSEDYKGFHFLKNENRIKQSKSLENYDDVLELLRFFDERYKNVSKKWFPFRVPVKGNSRSNILKASKALGWDTPVIHDSSDKIEDIDGYMNSAPSKHTVILIKGFWRASKRINHQYVGGSYETSPKIEDTSATAQGLTARFCSTFKYTGDQENIDLRPVHYCDLKAIDRYLEWIDKGCDYSKADYNGPRLKSHNGVVVSKASKVHHSNIVGLGHLAEEREQLEKEELRKLYRVFKNFTSCTGYLRKFGRRTKFTEKPNGEGPTGEGQPNYEGWYVCNLSSSQQKPNYLTEAIHKVSYKTGGGKSGKTAIPVYLDAKNKDSQVVWFVFVPQEKDCKLKPNTKYDEILQKADEEFPNEAEQWESLAKDFRDN